MDLRGKAHKAYLAHLASVNFQIYTCICIHRHTLFITLADVFNVTNRIKSIRGSALGFEATSEQTATTFNILGLDWGEME